MNVVIISDSSIAAMALQRSLTTDFEDVKKFTRMTEVRFERDWTNTVVVYDLSRPAEEVQSILQFLPAAALERMVVLTKETQDFQELMPLLGRVGAIVPHSSNLEEIALIARLARSGLLVLPTEMMPFVQARSVGIAPPLAPEPKLTTRELSILGMLAKGCSNKRIAYDLGINDTTVRVHVRSILRKLGVNNRTEAALYVRRNGEVK